MELFPNLHWLEGRSNTYLWLDETGLIVVDAGMPRDAAKILGYVAEIGRQPTDLKAIFLTHADLDHAGGLAVIQERSGAKVFTGPRAAELIRAGKSPQHMPRLIQFVLDHFIHYRPVETEAIELVSARQQVPGFDEWRALATPGHSLDHFSFFNVSRGVLFAGDALDTRGGKLHCSRKRISADAEAAAQSAIELLRLTPAVIACGHGPPMYDHSSDDLMLLYQKLQQARNHSSSS